MDLEGNYCDVIEMRLGICLGGLRKTIKNLSWISGVPGDIRTDRFQNENLEHYRYANMVSTEIILIPYKFKLQFIGFLET
jgi:hypothetical protein